MEGFDVSAIVGGEDLVVWVDYNDRITVQVKYIDREKFADLIKKATTTNWDRKHQKQEVVDNLKFGELLGDAAIADWRGMVVNKQEFPCNEQNRALVMRKWTDFAKFVGEVCTDLERLVEAEQESAKKNSETTSGQKAITQG